jgi:hypothetical protein
VDARIKGKVGYFLTFPEIDHSATSVPRTSSLRADPSITVLEEVSAMVSVFFEEMMLKSKHRDAIVCECADIIV